VIVDGHAVRAVTRAEAARVQALLERDPPGWELLDSAPLRPDEALHLFDDPPPPGARPEARAHYLVDDVALLGVLADFPAPRTWVLGVIFVAPEARGGGLGTRLIGALADHVRAAGGAALRLGVSIHNVRARRFYDRLGFARVDHRVLPTWHGGTHPIDVLELPL
jgi:ribosomal protein S18 acetylase RimI-like enzyme